jgi:hypothetical protein
MDEEEYQDEKQEQLPLLPDFAVTLAGAKNPGTLTRSAQVCKQRADSSAGL